MDELQHTSATTREFTVESLKEITSDFSKEHIVGSGAYGVVYRGVLDKDKIAIKQFRYMMGLSNEHFNNEFHILKRTRHKNIVQLVGYCHHQENMSMKNENGEYFVATVEHSALCFEYLEGGSLDRHLSYEPCTLDWHECYNIIKGISEGLDYLHNGCIRPIYHLDLKPENILLDEHKIPKIGDFGLSRDFTSTNTMIAPKIIGTQGYMPPEYEARGQITSKFDVFSLGVIMIEIMAGQTGYHSYVDKKISRKDFIRHVRNNWEERPPAPVWSPVSLEVKACMEIALKCVEADRTKRPDITTIVEEINKIETSRSSDQASNSGQLFNQFMSAASMVDPCIRSAAGWGLSTAAWMISPIIALLMNYGGKSDDSEKIKKLVDLVTNIVPELIATLEAAEGITSPGLYGHLLSGLKSAMCDVENILDEVEYAYLKKQLVTRKKRRHSSEEDLGPLYKGIGTIESNWTIPGPLNHRLETNMETIENLIFEAHQKFQQMNLHSGPNVRENIRNPTTAYEQVVIGQEREKVLIKGMLRDTEDGVNQSSSDSTCFSVIGIYGIAGSGKTTLAMSVFISERIEGYFDLVMWIHISMNFSVDSLLREMLEQASENIAPINIYDVPGELKNKLHEKRFLLVLDDVWSGDEQLGQLLSSLKVGKRGSKILVTSRRKKAILALGAVRCIPISDMSPEALYILLMHYSLDDATNDNPDGRKLRKIGQEIAQRLKGSPLAARIVAGRLRQRPTVEYWRRVLDTDLFSDTRDALWWSYLNLGEQVRRCFVYCSIFPRRYHLYRDELVNLWVAEGFIKSTDAEQDNVAVGQGYFDELVSASFLMLGGEDSGHSYYLVHDLLHDLAEMLGGSHCFRIEKGWTGKVPQDVRHLFLETYNRDMLAETIFNLSNLRTLIMYKLEGDIPIEENVLTIMFMKLKKLRVLIVYDCGEHIRVPEVIGQLKHLRYISLKMSSSSSVILPGTLTKLYLMQLLDLGKCSNVTFSYGEEDIVKLVNLRHVVGLASPYFGNIGRLTSVQTLPIFTARKKQGYELKQLRGLNKLEGSLEIRDLGVVKSKEEALEANLAGKVRLTELILDWGGDESCSEEVEAEVLEGLCPPMYLERLQIQGYQGVRYPSWMSEQNGPTNLHELALHKCRAIPYSIGLFRHLRLLQFSHCDWDTLPHDMVRLTSLKRLMIYDCLNIRSLPLLPQSVEKFELTGCDEVFMQSCLRTGDENWKRIQYVPMKKISISSQKKERK